MTIIPRALHVLNLGVGVQSTTLAMLAEQGLLLWQDMDRGTDADRWRAKFRNMDPAEKVKFDVAVVADTGDEPEAVYDHLGWMIENVSLKILVRAANPTRNAILTELTPSDGSVDRKTIRARLIELGRDKTGSLGDDLTRGQNARGGRFAAIPAFTTTTEGTLEGKTKRQCTKEYKTEVIERTIRREVCGLEPRQRIKRDIELHQYLGLSFDEPKRIFGRGERPGVKDRIEMGAYANKFAHFPLFDLYLTRESCLAWLRKHIPHEVPRSACVYCPFKSNAEWRRLRENPADWARAVAVDTALRTTGSVANRDMNQKMYVHKQCVPLELADLDRPEFKMKQGDLDFFATQEETDETGCPDGICGV